MQPRLPTQINMTSDFCKPFKTIIWDWNGTLLNDLLLCVETINSLLEKRKLPILTDATYKEVFAFPVRDYYEKAGFDFSKEDFEIPAKEFTDQYNSKVNECGLHANVIEVLEQLRIDGKKQYILSAMKQDMLTTTLKQNNIYYFFEDIVGLDNHYAASKIERGKQLIRRNKIEKETALMIGDTEHDFEVAEELGIACILIADGHQSKKRLENTRAKVLNSLQELIYNSLKA